MIEAHVDNTGTIFIADSESNATTTNRHALDAGDRLHFNADNWADIDMFHNLKRFWFDGTTGDKLVVSYHKDVKAGFVDGMVNV